MGALLQDFIAAAKVDVSGREIVQARVVAAMTVVLNKGLDLMGEVAGQEIVLQKDAVFERLVPAIDIALGLWMIRRAAMRSHNMQKTCLAIAPISYA